MDRVSLKLLLWIFYDGKWNFSPIEVPGRTKWMSFHSVVIGNHLGEVSALAAALMGALSSLWFRSAGVVIPPVQLNLYKGIIAVVLCGHGYRPSSWGCWCGGSGLIW